MPSDAIQTGLAEPMPDPNLAMDDLMADFARRNPSLSWLPQMLAMKRQALADSLSVIDSGDTRSRIDELESALARCEARCAKLLRLNEETAAELDNAYERLADAAAIVGACGQCWGEDPRCRSCRGRGRPGRFAPDPAVRARFFAEPLASGSVSPSAQPQA
jgi:erythromycin esterase-like protein